MNRKFVPCIYLYRGRAVRSLQDKSIVDTDPVRLARYYSENNADEMIVFDMSDIAAADGESALAEDSKEELTVSNDDALHEEALDIMKEICAAVEVDVIGAGNVKRMEDIKKILYTGCKKAVLDYEKASNIEITQEVSLKFGKEKLLVSFSDPAILAEKKDLIDQYISSMILLEKVAVALKEKGYTVGNVDVTMIAQKPKLRPYIPQMEENIARVLQVSADKINVKATTEEHLGFTGDGSGMSCHAVCILE